MGTGDMPRAMTSASNPLRIDSVATPGGGLIGMTICPGKKQLRAQSGNWDRDLGLDLDLVCDWSASAVVTLMEAPELVRFSVEGLGRAVEDRRIVWLHLPIVDGAAPDEAFETAWAKAGPELREHLRAGRKILLHCRGGLGRTGTVAARLLIELGMPADEAIAKVRRARRGAIETPDQERYVRSIMPAAPGLPETRA